MRVPLLICFWLLLGHPVGGAVFQYSIPVATSKGESSAFLWTPPEAKQVRGVVMAGMTLIPRLRKSFEIR